jgi:hypothetical protein
MSSNDPSLDLRPDVPVEQRLDSWKEIAAYLKRSVRSVQRWEAEEGMPVHRHLHDKRGTVYGFKSELDSWWRERGAILADRNGEEESGSTVAESETADARPAVVEPTPSAGSRTPQRAALVGAGFAMAVLLVAGVAWLSRNGNAGRPPKPLPFNARDWVLVTSFENRTGERMFDGTLEYALTRELASSRHVNVVPRERIEDALRLMRRQRTQSSTPRSGAKFVFGTVGSARS